MEFAKSQIWISHWTTAAIQIYLLQLSFFLVLEEKSFPLSRADSSICVFWLEEVWGFFPIASFMYYIFKSLLSISFWSLSYFKSLTSRQSELSYAHFTSSHPISFTPTYNTIILEKAMATHSSTFAWKLPWMEGPRRLQSMGSLRVRHDWATSILRFTFMHWRRKWQPTPVFLPGESQGWGILVGYHLWGRTESDTTEAT